MTVLRDRSGHYSVSHKPVFTVHKPSDRCYIPDHPTPYPALCIFISRFDRSIHQIVTQRILASKPILQFWSGCGERTDDALSRK